MTKDISEKIRESINACDFFSDISLKSIEILLKNCEIVNLNTGDILFHQGDLPEYFYILISGALYTFLTKINGQKMIVGHIYPVEPVGELGAFALKPHSMTIVANADSSLIRLPSHIFRNICANNASVMAKMSNNIVERSLNTLKFVSYENTNINIMLVYVNDIRYSEILKNKFLSLHDPELIFIPIEKIKIEDIDIQLNDASKKQINIIFYMHEWNPAVFNSLLKWLTIFYIIVNEEEKSFTNLSKTIFFELKKTPNIRNELIILHSSSTNKIINTRKWLDKADFVLHHHIRINEENDFSRLIRFMTGKAVALVLGGGGVRGLSHLGVIKGILDSSLPIDAIGGTSVGAAVGACYALNLNYDQAMTLISKLKQASFKSLRIINAVWPIISLFSSDPATSLLIFLMNNMLIEDLPIPYFAMVSDIKNKKSITMKTGLIWEAVRSSTAVPGLIPPVAYNGDLYADGGLLNNLPVDCMREMIGSKHIIIASSISKRDSEKTYYSFPPVIGWQKSLLLKLGIGKKNYVIPPFFETFMECMLLGASERENFNAKIADILVRPHFYGFKTFSLKNEEDELKLIQVGYDRVINAILQYKQKENTLIK